MGKFEKLAGVLALSGALAAPVEAQENQQSVVLAAMNNTSGQVTDCVGFVREQRDLARENNIIMSRADQRSLLHQCNNGQLEARIAEQEQIIATLNEQIAHLQMRVDENGRIIDEQGRELARLIVINGQLILRRSEVQAETARLNADTDRLNADTERMLQEAERILQSLATS